MADSGTLTALDHARLLRMLLAHAVHLSDVTRARRVVDEATAVDPDDRAEHNRRVAADRLTAEADLFTARARPWDATAREDLAATYGLALTWQQHSLLARDIATDLREHLRHRHAVLVHPDGTVALPDPAAVETAHAAAVERAHLSRATAAYWRVMGIISDAEQPGIYTKATLAQTISATLSSWTAQPHMSVLSALHGAMAGAGVPEPDRRSAVFAAGYLLGDVWAAPTRLAAGPVVDPVEEAKSLTDELLDEYRVALFRGDDATALVDRIAEQTAVLTPADRDLVEQRRAEFDTNPGGFREPLWPNVINRREVRDLVDAYAGQVLDSTAYAGPDRHSRDALTSIDLQSQLLRGNRRALHTLITEGRGLVDIERDQLRLTLGDIDAGLRSYDDLPQLICADRHSADTLEPDLAAAPAHDLAKTREEHLRELLGEHELPAAVAAACDVAVADIGFAHFRIALGRSGAEEELAGGRERLTHALSTTAVPTGLRQQALDRLDRDSADAHRHGDQARDLHRQWDTAMAEARAREPVTHPAPKTPQSEVPQSVVAVLVAAAHPHAASPAAPAHPGATRAATAAPPGPSVQVTPQAPQPGH